MASGKRQQTVVGSKFSFVYKIIIYEWETNKDFMEDFNKYGIGVRDGCLQQFLQVECGVDLNLDSYRNIDLTLSISCDETISCIGDNTMSAEKYNG